MQAGTGGAPRRSCARLSGTAQGTRRHPGPPVWLGSQRAGGPGPAGADPGRPTRLQRGLLHLGLGGPRRALQARGAASAPEKPPGLSWPVLRQGRLLAPPADVPRALRAFPQLLPQVAVNLVAQNHTRPSSLSPGTGLTGQTQEGRGRAVRAFREDRFRPFPAFSSFQSHRIPGEWPFPLVTASSAASSMSL